MKAYRKKELVFDIISYLLILLFSYTAIGKLSDYRTFAVQLSQSPITTAYAGIISWALPAGELLTAIALILPRTRLLGFFASLFLMSLFTSYVYVILQYSFYIPCNCSGLLESMGWETHFWFNISFVVMIVAGILLEGTNRIRQKHIVIQQQQKPIIT
jgi:hypothetical protein